MHDVSPRRRQFSVGPLLFKLCSKLNARALQRSNPFPNSRRQLSWVSFWNVDFRSRSDCGALSRPSLSTL